MSKLHFRGNDIVARFPEGQAFVLSTDALLDRLVPKQSLTSTLLPPGCRALVPLGERAFVVVWESPPMVRNVRWIKNDSKSDYGPGTSYRQAVISLPYVVVLAPFVRMPNGLFQLCSMDECFFRNEPLRSLDDPVFYPALLNVSKMPHQERQSLAWICTQHLKIPGLHSTTDPSTRMDKSLRALIHHLFDSAFNRSSERHEGSSWFAETVKAKVDPRLSSVEAWEQATKEDPTFAVEVPWIPTGLSVTGVIQRIGKLLINVLGETPSKIKPHIPGRRLITNIVKEYGKQE